MRFRRQYLIASIVMLGFVLMLIYAFYQLNRIERTLSSFVGENMLWVINQTDRETRNFTDTLLMGQETADAMSLRINILESRLALLNEKPQRDYFVAIGGEARLDAINQIIKTAISQIKALLAKKAPDNSADINQIYQDLRPVFVHFGRLGNLSMLNDRNMRGHANDQQAHTIYLIMFAVAGMMATAVSMALMLIYHMRAADKANQQLLQHKENLEEQIAQRTAELQHALIKEQETSEIYKGFLTTVSHQFKTPIFIIDLIAQRFLRNPEDITQENIIEASKQIREAVGRLNRIMESTASSEMLSKATVELKIQRFDLVEMTRNACVYHAETSGCEHTVFKSNEVSCFFNGDQTLLEQVILNLLSNAEKYAPEGLPIEVTINCDKDFFCCSVKDYGMGIPAKDIDKIFSRFFRADNVAHLSGTGLGLALSKQIILMHNGRITVQSVASQYSIFSVFLPLHPAA